MEIVHHRQRGAWHAAGALVPPIHAERRRHQSQERQHAPLHRRLWQVMGVAEQQKGRQHHQQGANVEVAEASVLWLVAGMACQQMLVQHLPGRIGEVGQLQQQETDEEVRADAVETNHCGPCHRDQRRHQRPTVETTVQRVLDQRHVHWRQDGEQQHLRHAQDAEAQVQTDVGDAELQRADQQHGAQEARFDLTPARQRQEHQPGEQHPGEHGKVAVDVASEVFADQAERESLDEGDDQKVLHGASRIGEARTLAHVGRVRPVKRTADRYRDSSNELSCPIIALPCVASVPVATRSAGIAPRFAT